MRVKLYPTQHAVQNLIRRIPRRVAPREHRNRWQLVSPCRGRNANHHVTRIGVGPIPIELVMFRAVRRTPDSQCLRVPPVVCNGAILIIGLLDGDFPIVRCAVGWRIWIWMRAVVAVGAAFVPKERVQIAATVVIAPKEGRVVARLSARKELPDIGRGIDRERISEAKSDCRRCRCVALKIQSRAGTGG